MAVRFRCGTAPDEGMKMPKKQIHIWVETDTLSRLKSGAVAAGKSLSDFADITLRRGLDPEVSTQMVPGERGDSVTAGSSTSPSFDTETLRKAVEVALRTSGLDTLKAEIQALERTLYEGQRKEPDPERPPGFSWTKDQAVFLIYTVACIAKFFEEYNAAWNTNDQQKVMTRTRIVNESGKRAVQKYVPDGEKDGEKNE